jgi:hypothetical protein
MKNKKSMPKNKANGLVNGVWELYRHPHMEILKTMTDVISIGIDPGLTSLGVAMMCQDGDNFQFDVESHIGRPMDEERKKIIVKGKKIIPLYIAVIDASAGGESNFQRMSYLMNIFPSKVLFNSNIHKIKMFIENQQAFGVMNNYLKRIEGLIMTKALEFIQPDQIVSISSSCKLSTSVQFMLTGKVRDIPRGKNSRVSRKKIGREIVEEWLMSKVKLEDELSLQECFRVYEILRGVTKQDDVWDATDAILTAIQGWEPRGRFNKYKYEKKKKSSKEIIEKKTTPKKTIEKKMKSHCHLIKIDHTIRNFNKI